MQRKEGNPDKDRKKKEEMRRTTKKEQENKNYSRTIIFQCLAHARVCVCMCVVSFVCWMQCSRGQTLLVARQSLRMLGVRLGIFFSSSGICFHRDQEFLLSIITSLIKCLIFLTVLPSSSKEKT